MTSIKAWDNDIDSIATAIPRVEHKKPALFLIGYYVVVLISWFVRKAVVDSAVAFPALGFIWIAVLFVAVYVAIVLAQAIRAAYLWTELDSVGLRIVWKRLFSSRKLILFNDISRVVAYQNSLILIYKIRNKGGIFAYKRRDVKDLAEIFEHFTQLCPNAKFSRVDTSW